MTILDIGSRLDDFDDNGVIFAERIDDAFVPESRAVVVCLTRDEQNQNVIHVAARRCPDLEYCLEIRIARYARRVWSNWRDGRAPSALEAAEAICHKATYDAWGPPKS